MAERRTRVVGLGVDVAANRDEGHSGIGMHGLVAFEGFNGSADGDRVAE